MQGEVEERDWAVHLGQLLQLLMTMTPLTCSPPPRMLCQTICSDMSCFMVVITLLLWLGGAPLGLYSLEYLLIITACCFLAYFDWMLQWTKSSNKKIFKAKKNKNNNKSTNIIYHECYSQSCILRYINTWILDYFLLYALINCPIF